jgi:transposase
MASAMNQTDARRNGKETDANVGLSWRAQTRRNYTVEQKRAIVAECLEPGASLSSVALKHGMNANMVRKWVVQERAGRLVATKRGRKPAMLPVVMSDESDAPVESDTTTRSDVRIEIETSHGVLRVIGKVDVSMMEALLAAMLRG